MDHVVRKRVIHIEFEPNWESGFLLQFWMMPIIEAFLSWCCSDVSNRKKSLIRHFNFANGVEQSGRIDDYAEDGGPVAV